MKLCSCPLESMYCLKKCPGVHSTLDKCYYSVPSTKHNFCIFRWLQHHYNITIPANKCSIQNKHTLLNKSNLPLGQCSVFLQGQYPNKIWSIPWTVASCPLKECSVHFQMSNPPFKGAVPLSEKSIFLHNICSIIDIEHPFQKCNMLETVSSTKECSFASYHDTPPSRVQSCFFFLFLFFGVLIFWILVLFSHSRKTKQNCQWLQSSERTIAHVQCQWLQNAVKNRTPRVSPSES